MTGQTIELGRLMNCITALAPARDGTLIVANGSAKNPAGRPGSAI